MHVLRYRIMVFFLQNQIKSFTTSLPTSPLKFLMAGYLDYWCSLDITGSAERDSLTVALETEFEDFERIVDTLIEERQKRRREIAAELVPIEAAI